jgi:hypothetical protein
MQHSTTGWQPVLRQLLQPAAAHPPSLLQQLLAQSVQPPPSQQVSVVQVKSLLLVLLGSQQH